MSDSTIPERKDLPPIANLGILRNSASGDGGMLKKEAATWETAALRGLFSPQWLFLLIAIFAIITRVWNVAAKPLHHDESLFAYYGYYLYKGFGYDYQPILHGALLQNISALFFLIFGDNNLTMRLPVITGGLAMFIVFWHWRRYLGRAGVVAVLVLLAVSPSITYYSRFLRNDAPYLMVTVWCALCLLRALDTGRRLYVFGAIITAGIMFCMMESSIFFFAACIGFLVVTTLADWIRGWGLPASAPRRYPGHAIFFVPRAPPCDGGSAISGGSLLGCLAAAALLELLVGWLFYRMFYSTVHIYKPVVAMVAALGGTVTPRAANWILAAALYSVFYIFCLVIIVNWRRPFGESGALHYFLRVCGLNLWIILAGFSCALALYTILFTTWFTNLEGADFWGKQVVLTPLQIYKNTWDYWWDQHQLHRIKGPFHYYLPILLLYELPAIVLVLWGWWRSMTARGRLRGALALIAPHIALAIIYLTGVWAAGGYFNKRIDWDWLDKTLHFSNPAHLFLLVFYAQLLTQVTVTIWARGRLLEAFLTFWTVTSLFAYSYAGEKVPWLAIHTTGPLLLLAAYYTQRLSEEIRWATPNRIVAAMAIGVAVVWQVRALTYANFVHPASPAERIVYNHTSPDVDYAVERIREIGRRANYGNLLPIFVKGEMEWPIYWCLRDWQNFIPPPDETIETTSRPIVLVNWEESLSPNLRQNYVIQRLKLREWWEAPMLDLTAMSGLWRVFTPIESRRPGSENEILYDRALLEWKKLLHYLAYRQIWLDPLDPQFSNGANEMAFCVHKDLDKEFLNPEWLWLMPPRRDIPLYP
ncbi:MAG: TIGR03663 family protein [Candidatus Sumerlaeota bacterium]|nr:TIGR03663 family protein [Candidatus Sumerlaeota bacterium]